MGRTVIGVIGGFALGFGCAFLFVGRGHTEEPRTEEEMMDAQIRAQEKADRDERQMLKENRKKKVVERDSDSN